MKITIKQKLLLLQLLSFVCAPTLHAWDGGLGEELINNAVAVAHVAINGGKAAHAMAVKTPVYKVGANVVNYFGKNAANAVKAGGKYVYDKVQYTFDTFGPNIKHELQDPLARAIQENEYLMQKDPLYKPLCENDVFKIDYKKDEEVVQALQVIISMLEKDVDVMIISTSLKSYKKILDLLEHPIMQSYAKNGKGESLHSLLSGYGNSLTPALMSARVKECQEAARALFTGWKSAQEQQLFAFKSAHHTDAEKAQKEKETKAVGVLYDQCIQQVSQALTLYGTYFLMVKQLQALVQAVTDKPTNVTVANKAHKEITQALDAYTDAIEAVESNVLYQNIKQSQLQELEQCPALIVVAAYSKKDTATKVKDKIDDFMVLITNLDTAMTEVKNAETTHKNNIMKAHYEYIKEYDAHYQQMKKLKKIIESLTADAAAIPAFVTKHTAIHTYKHTASTQSTEFAGVTIEELTAERSKGIAVLSAQFNGSITHMIRAAEKEKDAYQKRKGMYYAFLQKMVNNNVYKTFSESVQKLVDAVVNGETQSTEDFTHMLTEYQQAYIDAVAEDTLTLTPKDRECIEQVLTEAIQDLEKSINALIVADWTVVGVKAKMAFESLKCNDEKVPTALAKKAAGTVLDGVRRALVAVEKGVRHDDYHVTTRNAVKKDLKDAGTVVAQKATEAKGVIKEVAPKVGEAIVEGATKAGGLIFENAPKIGKAISDAADVAATELSKIGHEVVQPVLTEAAQQISDEAQNIGKAILIHAPELFNAAKGGIIHAGTVLSTKAQETGHALGEAADMIGENVKNGVAHIKEWVNEKRGIVHAVQINAESIVDNNNTKEQLDINDNTSEDEA